jgi:hypothetical protein
VGYLVFGIQRTSDPVEVRASLDGMTDVDLPPGLGSVDNHRNSTMMEATWTKARKFRAVFS